MSYLALVVALVKALGSIASYMGEKRLIDAGVAEAVARGQGEVLDALAKQHRVTAALATGGDPAWLKRVRELGRRA